MAWLDMILVCVMKRYEVSYISQKMGSLRNVYPSTFTKPRTAPGAEERKPNWPSGNEARPASRPNAAVLVPTAPKMPSSTPDVTHLVTFNLLRQLTRSRVIFYQMTPFSDKRHI